MKRRNRDYIGRKEDNGIMEAPCTVIIC
jgi:hypothetical protein